MIHLSPLVFVALMLVAVGCAGRAGETPTLPLVWTGHATDLRLDVLLLPARDPAVVAAEPPLAARFTPVDKGFVALHPGTATRDGLAQALAGLPAALRGKALLVTRDGNQWMGCRILVRPTAGADLAGQLDRLHLTRQGAVAGSLILSASDPLAAIDALAALAGDPAVAACEPDLLQVRTVRVP